MPATSYDFKKVTTTVDGEIMTEYMDGTAISVEKNEDDVILHVGADGKSTFSEQHDNSGTVTLTLKQTSPSLKKIHALVKARKNFPIQIKDNNGSAIVFNAADCRIQKTPGREWGNEVSGVEVTIITADLNPTA